MQNPFDDIAAIRNPMPEPGHVSPPEYLDDAREQAAERRQADADNLEAASDGTGIDPLMLALEQAYSQRQAADAMIRRLLAYGREFHGSRPYQLEALARPAGLTASGVRTAYSGDIVEEVAGLIGRRPDGRSRKAHRSRP